MNVTNKTVLVTGASSGIGTACAEQFAKAGAKLILCARRRDKLEEWAKKWHETYGVMTYCLPLDISQPTAVKKTFASLPTEWQAVDILVNNAGLACGMDTLQEGNCEDWEKMIDTNVKGLLYITHEVLPQMVERNAGHIINIGSIAGHQVYPKGAVYCATKHAVKALSEGLRMDLFGKKIRVSCVDPGMVATDFSNVRFKGDTKRAAEVYEGVEALTASDIADAVLYCATRPLHEIGRAHV